MQPEPPFSDITIHLRHSVVQPGNSPLSTSAITVPLSTGVDLGLVGRVLGLDPSTLRLNGYYVSRSLPSHVSPGLLWGQLLEFFAQRGIPCGVGIRDAIVVQGKHMGSKDGNPFMKRKFHLENECPQKKRKANINYRSNKIACPSTKRSLEFQLETERSPKKRKLEVNHRPNKNASAKRSVNSDDASVTFKKGKITYSNADTQKSHTDENLVLKRKIDSEAECYLKKRKLTNNKPRESVIPHIKRIVKRDDIQVPFKRMKMTYSITGAQKAHTSMHVFHVSSLAITV